MKVLFVIHNLDFADHLAVAYLSAIARQLGHQTFFCCLATDDMNVFVTDVEPDVVAYSVNIIGFQETVKAHKLALRTRRFISIMGGPHPTFSPETFNESGMDAYCVGEGEYPFRDFLQRVESGNSFDDVPNLITAKGSNPVRSLISNLDELPMPDRDLTQSNSFLRYSSKKTFYVSRGCPFKCSYCCNNYYHELYQGKGPSVRKFSVERIITEIEDVSSKYRMDFVKFGDDCFALKADDWIREFSEKYSKRIGVPFNCYLRIDTIDDELLSLLKKAGCFSVHLSVDSTSKRVREEVLLRQMRSEDIVERLKMVRRHGINTWVNFMLAAPESTLKDDLDTIRVSKEGWVTYPSYTTTVPMEKTALFDYCAKNNLIDPSQYTGDMNGILKKSGLSGFTEKEIDIRYNVLLLGAIISRLPHPLMIAAIELIKFTKPNKLYKRLNEYYYQYSINNNIFRLPRDNMKKPRALDYGKE